jgi:hypothetical protein
VTSRVSENTVFLPRVIAVDWSGATEGSISKIWLAEIDPTSNSLIRLEAGRTRQGVAEYLLDRRRSDPRFVVGFDFAFSFPEWFVVERNLPNAPALWDVVVEEGERWLRECCPPFWGRPGIGKPNLSEHFRRTDLEVPAVAGIRPKSVFQIGGAGAVGTGSIRGMPSLKLLRDGGFSIWPFDAPAYPMVVEIYPRVLTGAVVKQHADVRLQYLERNYQHMSRSERALGASSEDAFDALVAAAVMAEHISELQNLAVVHDPSRLREGQIWFPRYCAISSS